MVTKEVSIKEIIKAYVPMGAKEFSDKTTESLL